VGAEKFEGVGEGFHHRGTETAQSSPRNCEKV
jgi:hypothetical protein